MQALTCMGGGEWQLKDWLREGRIKEVKAARGYH